MGKVSIVVPVYKVEKYLSRCVDSLKNQTLEDIEIILVDDGSPDRCPELCDQFVREDGRIKVVHKENGGLSSARNAGLKVATGDYVGFVDSDDDVNLQMYEKMYRIMESEKVDFVMSDYIRVQGEDDKYLKTLSIREGRYNKEDIRRDIYPQLIMGSDLEYGPLLSVCHCLYRTDFLRKYDLEFDEKVRWSEDNIFSAFVGYYADSFYYLKGEGLYHYYNNLGTITTSYRKGAWEVYSRMNRHLHQFFDQVSDYDFGQQLKLHLIFYACNCLGQVKLSSLSPKEQMQLRKEIMSSEELRQAFHHFEFPKWPWKLKLQVLLIKWRLAGVYSRLIG